MQLNLHLYVTQQKASIMGVEWWWVNLFTNTVTFKNSLQLVLVVIFSTTLHSAKKSKLENRVRASSTHLRAWCYHACKRDLLFYFDPKSFCDLWIWWYLFTKFLCIIAYIHNELIRFTGGALVENLENL